MANKIVKIPKAIILLLSFVILKMSVGIYCGGDKNL